jgi:hypothetical protein
MEGAQVLAGVTCRRPEYTLGPKPTLYVYRIERNRFLENIMTEVPEGELF